MIGAAFVISGIMGAVDGEIMGGIAIILFGAAIFWWGKTIIDDKAFQKWWKQVTDANLEPQIAASVNVAVQIYRKNPQKRTLKKIAQLNPQAAQYIEKQIAAKK